MDIPLLFESGKGEAAPQIRFEPAYWSLVPGWSKTLKLKASSFNARAEVTCAKPFGGDEQWLYKPNADTLARFVLGAVGDNPLSSRLRRGRARSRLAPISR